MPQLKGLHIDRLLTNFSQKYQNAAFVNERLFPVVPVEKESDLYSVYGLEMFNIYESRRANGGRSNEVDWTVGTERYSCEQYSLSDLVTDRSKDNADKPLTIEMDTVEFVQDTLDLAKEYRAAQIARNPSNYIAANTEALSGTSRWDQSGSTPTKDITTAKKAIWKASRKMPNTIMIPNEIALEMSTNPEIVELRKYTDPNLLTDSGLPKRLLGLEVVEAGAGYNAANPGQQAQIADVWGKDIIIAYVDPKPKLKTQTYGLTFRTNKYVKKWRVEEREGDMVEVNDINDLAMIMSGCGFLLQSVIN